MIDKPLCPYCGEHNGHPEGVEMIPLMDGWEGVTLITNHYHMCPVCKTSSPKHKNAKTALRLALRRFKPPQKPLTLEEVKELQREPVYLVSLGEDFEDGWQLCVSVDSKRMHCLMFYALLFLEQYGKTWCCFRMRPTDEERAAAKWEEKTDV